MIAFNSVLIMSKSLSSGCFSLVFKIDKTAIFCFVFEMKCECERTNICEEARAQMNEPSECAFASAGRTFTSKSRSLAEERSPQQPSQLGWQSVSRALCIWV